MQGSRYNVIVPTAYGTMIVNRNDWMEVGGERFGVGWDLMQGGHYVQPELDNLATLIRMCRADPVVLDIGANIGVHSLWFSSLVGAHGVVHAFEAQRIVFQMLMGNLAINSVENVHARQVAIGAAPGRLRLPPVDYARNWNFGGMGLVEEGPHPQFAPGSVERARAERGESIDVITLDSLALARVDFIKIDVEGMERDVLAGARATIERDRPLMQVEWLARDQGALPAYLLDDLGYRIYQSTMNLLCVPAERSDLAVAGATEVTFDLLRAHFELS